MSLYEGSAKKNNIVTWRLEAGIEERETAISRQKLSKRVAAEMNAHSTIERI
jgi:hypothetical protein